MVAGALAWLIASLAVLLLIPLARRIGWVDHPDARKRHDAPTPLVGGLAILLAMLITAALVSEVHYPTGLSLAASSIFLVGFIDDRYPLRARYRLVVQLAAAAAIVLIDGTVLRQLGECFGPIPTGLSVFAMPFTVVAIVGLINATNMMDGADGLCSGIAAIALGWLLVAAAFGGEPAGAPLLSGSLGGVLIVALGAVVAFLGFNLRAPWRKRASAFLGDGGSMLLGLLLAWATIALASGAGPGHMPASVAVWIVAVPLTDMFSAILRRLAAGQTPMTADRHHVHHLLQAHGLSVGHSVTALHLATLVSGAFGVIGWRLGVAEYVQFWLLVALFIAYHVHAHRFWRRFVNTPSGRAGARSPGSVTSTLNP